MLKTKIELNERERAIAENTIQAMLDLIDPLKTEQSVEARYDLKLLLNKFKKTTMKETMKECIYCGEEILLQARKCKHCQSMLDGSKPKQGGKDKTLAGLLAIILGGLGVHKFYLGETKYGFIYLLFFWTYIPALFGLIEGIQILTMSRERFDNKFNK